MKYPIHFGILLALTSCHPATPEPVAGTGQNDRANDRIVSLDYCADQMLLGLVEKSRIAAVSHEVASDPLFSEPLARGLPRVRPDIERVLALRPTLVVRSYGGGPRMEQALRRAGIPVFTLPYADDFPSIRRGVTASGKALNAAAAANRRLTEFDRALSAAAALPPPTQPLTALYVTPGDVTTGPDSLVGRLMLAAGFASYEPRPGWHRLPVERLIAQQPGLVVRGFYDSPAHRQDNWSASGHHVLAQVLAKAPSIDIAGSDVACGNWLVGRALERLTAIRVRSDP